MATKAGHHVKTIESLEFTLKPDAKVIQKFKAFHNKRNKSVYDIAGEISAQELESMINLATELKTNTLAWLREVHPKLMEGFKAFPVATG